jgi:flagellar biosynthesis protein FlhG
MSDWVSDRVGDQAETLRRLMQQRPGNSIAGSDASRSNSAFSDSAFILEDATPARCAPVLTISSGKGGVGKSCMASHLGTLLARAGLRVMLVDGDFGLANLDILLGVQPTATLEQVLSGQAKLQDSIVGVEPNLWLVPAASGIMDVRHSDIGTRHRIARLFEDCPWEMDLIILDIGAGIQSNVLSLHSPAFKSVIVLTPEPTSLTDAYGLIKTLSRTSAVAEFHILVNQVTDAREARAVYHRLKDVADRFIDVRIEFLGFCEKDEKITQSVMNRKILLDWSSDGAGSSRSLLSLAESVREKFVVKDSEKRHEMRLDRQIDALHAIGSAHLSSSSLKVGTLEGNTARFWRTLLIPDSVGMRSTR